MENTEAILKVWLTKVLEAIPRRRGGARLPRRRSSRTGRTSRLRCSRCERTDRVEGARSVWTWRRRLSDRDRGLTSSLATVGVEEANANLRLTSGAPPVARDELDRVRGHLGDLRDLVLTA